MILSKLLSLPNQITQLYLSIPYSEVIFLKGLPKLNYINQLYKEERLNTRLQVPMPMVCLFFQQHIVEVEQILACLKLMAPNGMFKIRITAA